MSPRSNLLTNTLRIGMRLLVLMYEVAMLKVNPGTQLRYHPPAEMTIVSVTPQGLESVLRKCNVGQLLIVISAANVAMYSWKPNLLQILATEISGFLQ